MPTPLRLLTLVRTSEPGLFKAIVKKPEQSEVNMEALLANGNHPVLAPRYTVVDGKLQEIDSFNLVHIPERK